MRSIADVLASAETSSNFDFLDSDIDNDDKGGTGFTRLREMQRFLRIMTTLTTSHAMMTLLIASMATSFHGHKGNN
jgi:hypothetical protein